jgi:hypothetical protein
MTQDEIIEMARQAGFVYASESFQDLNRQIEAFAKLVAQHEREACAELVWPKLKIWSEEEQTAMGLAFNRAQEKHGWYETLMAVGASVLKIKAEAIRARGQA